MKPFLQSALTDTRGYPSSTRLIAYKLSLYFFPTFNLLYLIGLMAGILILFIKGSDIPTEFTNFVLATSGFLFSLDSLLLAYVFLSKRTGKLAETSEIVEIAKVIKKDPLSDTPTP